MNCNEFIALKLNVIKISQFSGWVGVKAAVIVVIVIIVERVIEICFELMITEVIIWRKAKTHQRAFLAATSYSYFESTSIEHLSIRRYELSPVTIAKQSSDKSMETVCANAPIAGSAVEVSPSSITEGWCLVVPLRIS